MQDTPQYSTNMVRLFTMMRLQKSPPQAPPSWNPNAASTLECGGSTSTQQHRHLPQKPSRFTQNNQRHFRAPQRPRNIPLVPCIRGIPNQSDIHRRRTQRKLLHMAKTNGNPNKPLLPRLGRNDQGTSQGPTPRHTFDKTGSIIQNHQK